ncbi:MAG: rhomboid family intramembrane serine protease [Phycisphaerae bacterium]|jgi:membrane associated rhomboid family serine protease
MSDSMSRPPMLLMLARVPLTTTLCLAAVAVSAGSMFGLSTDPLVLDERAFFAQPWRLLTGILPHEAPITLVAGVFLAWTLGAPVEIVFGRRLWLSVVLFGVVASSSAEHGLTGTRVGLAGVVFSLFAFSWVVARRAEALAGLVDRRFALLIVAWFFTGLVVAWTGDLRIAVIAQLVGALQGALLGLALTSPRSWVRTGVSLVAAAVVLVSLMIGGPLGVRLNPAGAARRGVAAGYALLTQGDATGGDLRADAALALAPCDARVLAMYVLYCGERGRLPIAREAVERAVASLEGAGEDRSQLASCLVAAGAGLLGEDEVRLEVAEGFARLAHLVEPAETEHPWMLASTCWMQRGEPAVAMMLVDRAAAVAPESREVRTLRAEFAGRSPISSGRGEASAPR